MLCKKMLLPFMFSIFCLVAIDDLESGDVTDGHMTADEMDQKRKQNMAYEYLCHLEEAKK